METCIRDIKSKTLVEVFRTNVQTHGEAEIIIRELRQHLPHASINFDLEDCDKILRIANSSINPQSIITELVLAGFFCEVLED